MDAGLAQNFRRVEHNESQFVQIYADLHLRIDIMVSQVVA